MKLAATVLFVIAVVATPREAFWAFGVHAAVVFAAVLVARLPALFLLRRLAGEIPFVLFAAFQLMFAAITPMPASSRL